MSSTRQKIVATIISQKDVKFRPTLFNDLALSRQLVNYHLHNLVEEGVLDRDGVYYTILSDAGLREILLEDDEPSFRLLESKNFIFLSSQEVEEENTTLRVMVALKNFSPRVATELRTQKIKRYKEAIKEIKIATRYLLSRTMVNKSAARIIDTYGVSRLAKELESAGIIKDAVAFENSLITQVEDYV